jgi:hypothetical protein
MKTTSVEIEPVAIRTWEEKRMIYLELTEVQVEVDGYELRWEKLDKDLTVAGVVAGRFHLPFPRHAA